MKTWHKVAIGTAAAISIGAIGYAIYNSHQPAHQTLQQSPNEISVIGNMDESFDKFKRYSESKSKSDSISSSEGDTDIYSLMEEILVESLDNISIYAKIAAQVAQERPEEIDEFAIQIKQQGNSTHNMQYTK
jgi:hypothetical protein